MADSVDTKNFSTLFLAVKFAHVLGHRDECLKLIALAAMCPKTDDETNKLADFVKENGLVPGYG